MFGVDILRKLGLPECDNYDLSSSPNCFPDGADFRVEVPVVNSFDTFRAIVSRTRRRGVTVNRATETIGLFRHTREELTDYLRLAEDEGITMVFSVGPRATYDTSPTRLTQHGSFLGYRLRGADQIRRALDDVLRGLELGCRSFVVYDEGLLKVLGQARKEGLLPADTRFKASAHLGYANPISISILEELGADSINPVRDLPLSALAAIRQRVAVPLDVHTDNPPSSGGFIRTYEAPDMVRVARPVYLKTGNSMVGAHGQFTSTQDGERMADQAAITLETVQRFAPELIQSPSGPPAAQAVSAPAADKEPAGSVR